MAISLPIVSSFDNKGINRATRSLNGFGRNIGRISAVAATAFAGIGAAASKMAGEFETSFAKIGGLVGVSEQELGKLEDAALKLGPTFGKSAQEAADALFFITSAGLRGEAAIETLEASLKGAAIGLGETRTIADLATSAVNAYGQANLGATEAVDTLAEAVRLGKLEPEELAGAMGMVLPIASEMGVSFDQVGAAFAGMSKTGTNASVAATQLRQILFTIKKPTAEAEEQLAAMGLSAQGLRDQIREEGLLTVLQTLVESFGDNEEASAKVFGNVRALAGVLDLMGGNAEDNARIFELMADDIAITDEAVGIVSDTFEFKLAKALETAKTALIPLGDAINEIAGDLLDRLQPALENMGGILETAGERLTNLRGDFETAGTGASAALEPVKPLLDAFKTIGPVVAGLVTPFGLLGQVVQELGADYFEELTAILAELVEGPLLTLLDTIVQVLPAVISLAATFAELLLPILEAVADVALPALDAILKVLQPVIVGVSRVLEGTGEALLILTGVVYGTIKAIALYKTILGIAKGVQAAFTLATFGFTAAQTGAATSTRITMVAIQLLNGSLIRNTAVMIGGKVAMVAHATASGIMTAATNLSAFAMNKLRLGLVAARIATIAQTVATNAATLAQQAFNFALRMNPIGLVITAVAALVAGLVYFFTQTQIGQQIWTAFTTVVIETITAVADWFTVTFTETIPELWSTFTTFLSDTWQEFSEGFMTVLENIGTFFKSMINGYIGMWESFINFFIGGINKIINGLNQLSFDPPDWVKEEFGVGSWGVNIPNVPEVSLPRLADGGIVREPTIAMIGEAGPEAIIPLTGRNRPQGGITVNIQTGVGDPVRIGEEVVTAIKRYERASGPVFASA